MSRRNRVEPGRDGGVKGGTTVPFAAFGHGGKRERKRTMEKLPGQYALIETTGALFGLAFSVALIVAVFSVALAAFFHAFGF